MKRALSIVFVLSAAACGSAPIPPPELVNARSELVKAKQGPAATLDPTDIHEAQLALDRAERAFAEEPDSPITQDLAAIAQLKALSAEATAATMIASGQMTQAQRDILATQAEQLRAARGQLTETQGALQA